MITASNLWYFSANYQLIIGHSWLKHHWNPSRVYHLHQLWDCSKLFQAVPGPENQLTSLRQRHMRRHFAAKRGPPGWSMCDLFGKWFAKHQGGKDVEKMWKVCKYIYICILDYIRVSFYGNILVKHRFMRKPMKTQLFSIPYWKKDLRPRYSKNAMRVAPSGRNGNVNWKTLSFLWKK
jgi:hypothetical protein